MSPEIPRRAEAAAAEHDPFAGSALQRVVPTTESQRELWLADRLGRNASLAFNESVSLRFAGPLDTGALRAALQELVQRHEALRATISATGEELCIARDFLLDVPLTDHLALSPAGRETAITQAKQRAVETPFDLERGPLFRAEILKLGQSDHLLTITAHHIVCDGWSFGVIVRDLAVLYRRTLGLTSAAALEPAPSFGDYAMAHSAAAGGPAALADERYWVDRFSGILPEFDLPADRPRAAWRTFASRREDYLLDAELVASLRTVAAKSGASFFAALVGGFAATLHRLTGEQDLVIGIPAAGQPLAGREGLVGHCVNLLPLRVEVGSATSLKAAVGTARNALIDATEHQGFTYGTLLKRLVLPRDPSRLPLVSLMFNLDRALDPNEAGYPDLRVEFTGNPRSFENFELFVNAVQVPEGLRLECQYNTDLFDGSSVRRWLASYEAILRETCASIESTVGRVNLVGDVDRTLLAAWNATEQDFDRNAQVQELVESQTSRAPGRCALRSGAIRWSYGELNARANRIAHTLRARGLRRGMLVGLHLERGPDLVAALLGVLKTGAAYVPLDPSYPADRLAFMAQDAGLDTVISAATPALPMPWPREKLLLLDEDAAEISRQSDARLPREADASGTDRAYVIYTSGSTGRPKGVEVPHRAVVNFLLSMAREPGLTADDRIVAVTTLSFDIAVNELLLPLTVGAEILLASREESRDGLRLAHLLRDGRATIMQATPSTWRLLLGAGWSGGSDFRALCGGESLPPDLARELLARCTAVWNMYGPTETTVWSTCGKLSGEKEAISIGRPIANTRVHILDTDRQPCPLGVPGEIWIGGDGVTLGYLHQPALTAAVFVPDPFTRETGRLIYRTGDRGRWRSDGQLEHLGRNDAQVKVRGHRIEPAEIEARLASAPEVQQAVALAREDRPGDVRLVAYYVTRPGAAPAEAVLKTHLRGLLPEFMIPQHLVRLGAIPLLPNGKVDVRALPPPESQALAGEHHVAPRTDDERAVAAEMEASLGLTGIGIHDDFFALGGHSLLAAQLTYRLNRRLGSTLSMRTLFEAPTVARLAESIRFLAAAGSTVDRPPVTQLVNQARMPASTMQERMWYLEQMSPGRVVYHAPSAHRLRGHLNESAFEAAFRAVVQRQASLRTSFEREGDAVLQRVQEEVDVSLFPAEDLSALEPAQRDARLMERLEQLMAEPFDLSQAPLFRAHMFRMGEQEHVFFFMAHHIVWDGWSFDLLYDEMAALYAANCAGRPHALPALPISYGDFSVWHRDFMKSPELQRQLAFWRQRLTAGARPKPLPTDKPRRPGMSGAGSTEWIQIDKELTQALHELSGQSGATLFVTMLAVYAVLLHEYSRQTTVAIGTPVRGRDTPEFEAVMGYFNNLLPLQFEVRPAESFLDLLLRVKATVIESFAHPDVPLVSLQREVGSDRSAAGSVLYHALFSFQDARQRSTQWGGLRHSVVPIFQRGATEDFGLWFVETAEGLQGGVTYNTDILEPGTAQGLRERYLAILRLVVAQPDAAIEALADALPAPRAAHPLRADAGSYAAPRSDLEISLASVWMRVLKVERVGIHDNFFDLGGNSLTAIDLILEMEAAGGLKIGLGEVFLHPTIAQLVASLGPDAERSASVVVPLQPEGAGIPVFCLVGIDIYREFAASLGTEQPVFGVYVSEEQALVTQSLEGRSPDVSIDILADAYDRAIARFRPHGPYRLAGLSFGGILAMELASRMRARGEQVDVVILLDTMLARGIHTNWLKLLARPFTMLLDGSAPAKLRKLKSMLFGGADTPETEAAPDSRTARIDRANAIRRAALFQATNRWEAERLVSDFRVALFCGTDHASWGRHVEFDEDYGWRRFVSGPLFVHHVPGNHLTLIEAPNVSGLGNLARAYLRKEETPPPTIGA